MLKQPFEKVISWDTTTKDKDITVNSSTVTKTGSNGRSGIMSSKSLPREGVSRWNCRIDKLGTSVIIMQVLYV